MNKYYVSLKEMPDDSAYATINAVLDQYDIPATAVRFADRSAKLSTDFCSIKVDNVELAEKLEKSLVRATRLRWDVDQIFG